MRRDSQPGANRCVPRDGAYLRLVDLDDAQQWNGRGHFFAAAAEAMRRILVERARRSRRIRHGGGRTRLNLDQLESMQLQLEPNDGALAEQLIALDDALTRLDSQEPAAAAVVKLRYFAGLTIQEAAAALDVSVRTANRHWSYDKAWLYQRLSRRRHCRSRRAPGHNHEMAAAA